MCYSLWYNAPTHDVAGRWQISDNEIYLLIKYIKSVLWRVAKRLSYIEEERCLKVKEALNKDEVSGLSEYPQDLISTF